MGKARSCAMGTVMPHITTTIEKDLAHYYNALVNGDQDCDELYSDIVICVNWACVCGEITEKQARDYIKRADQY